MLGTPDGSGVAESLASAVGAVVGDSVGASVGDPVGAALSVAVGLAVGASCDEAVGDGDAVAVAVAVAEGDAIVALGVWMASDDATVGDGVTGCEPVQAVTLVIAARAARMSVRPFMIPLDRVDAWIRWRVDRAPATSAAASADRTVPACGK
jgi:hypothetical protein